MLSKTALTLQTIGALLVAVAIAVFTFAPSSALILATVVFLGVVSALALVASRIAEFNYWLSLVEKSETP